jgi:murein DD-endopeptidase MepM/ murein hydrolase activator NlpD
MSRLLRVAALLLCALLIVAAAPQERKSKEALEKELAAHQAKLEKLRARLQQSQAEVRQTRLDMREVDARLDRIQRDMQRTKEELAASYRRLDELTVERSQAALKVALKQDQLSRRLRTIYKQGEARFVSALVGTETVGDLASRSYILRRIASKDREIAEEYKAAKQELDDRCAEQLEIVEEIKAEMSRQLEEEREQHAALADKKQAYQQAVAEMSQRESEYCAENEATKEIEAELAAYYASAGGVTVKPWTGYYLKPVEGPITSEFGMRMHPILKVRKMHTGIDIAAPHGTPIHAAADGRVVKAEYVRGYGNCVIIDHGGGVATLYAHCSAFHVVVGQFVKQRDVIADVGSTGLATGPHVHFELRVNGKPVKPN